MNAIKQIEDIYNDYLNFVQVLESIYKSKEMYYHVTTFLTQSYNAAPLLVFSTHKTSYDKKTNKRMNRCVWNRKKIESHYSPEEIDLALDHIIDRKILPKVGHHIVEHQDHKIYISHIGEESEFIIYMVYKIPSKAGFGFDHRLQCSVFNSFAKISEYKSITNLKRLIHIDDVSGLYNQRKFILDIDEFIDRYDQIEEPFCVVFIDIDHFKKVNDNYGHMVGTKLLEEVGKVFQAELRDDDMSYRYGGDEFVALIPDGDIKCAKSISERILKAISENVFSFKIGSQEKVELHLSVSIGIASYPDDAKTKEDIITYADRMMYLAKESGRGRVCLAKSKKNDS